MKFIDIINVCKNMIDETDEDTQIDVIVKSGINEAYKKLQQLDKRLATAYLPVINGIATLPDDFLSLVKCTPELDETDKMIGRGQMLTTKTGTLAIIYSQLREDLSLDNDEPVLNILLQNALAPYACYKYFLYKKRPDVANMFFQNYTLNIADYTALTDELSEHIIDTVYTSSTDSTSYDW